MTELRPKKEILNWLQAHRSMNSFTGIVLKNGEWFSGRANVTDYEVTTTWKKCRRPRAQECFYNAQKFCMDHGHPYWEGYFLIGGQPMHHAWNVMDDGEVVDFTQRPSCGRRSERII